MFDRNGSRNDRGRAVNFSPIMICIAALLLVVLLVVGGLGGSDKTADTGIETTTSTDTLETTADEQAVLIDSLNESIADYEIRLEAANEEIAALRNSSDISAEIIDQLRQKAETVANPTKLYNQIIEKLAQAGISSTINPETNSLRFDDLLLFSSSSASLSISDQEILDDAFTIIIDEIEMSDLAADVDKLILAGYADDGGSLSLNLELSQKRAESVLDYLIQKSLITISSDINSTTSYACAGMADQKPIMTDGLINRELSRRVEVSIILDNRKISELVFGDD